MFDWKTARIHFFDLMDEIEQFRDDLRCSYSNAWFRGESQFFRNLSPSIIRINDFSYPIDFLFNEGKNLKEEIIEPDSDYDRSKLMRLNKSEYKKIINQISKYESEQFKLKKLNFDNYKLTGENKNSFIGRFDEIKTLLGQLKTEKRLLERKSQVIKGVHFGERDAFVDWSRRSKIDYLNSWVTLAEMQHYGVPTRLLDWTENLFIALYFAVEPFINDISKCLMSNKISDKDLLLSLELISEKQPNLWILNPYNLSEQSTGYRKLYDVVGEKDLDYYDSFFVKYNWRYENPIPIYPPRINSRIISQQGMFTVHGTNKESFNNLINETILKRVFITPMAAVYAVKHLLSIGMDEHYIYCDLDKLGKRVKSYLSD